ncbi:MAG: Trk system potassium transporter TrkA [Calditrichaeota bacterium]|nr:MAG: Trk system potassium transporter TrkA [Calditrichota bacterium]
MKILILGAGEVGFNLTRLLSAEHDITLIENDPHKVKRASEQLDAFIVEGNAVSYRTLKEAKIKDMDLLAAMTNNDEVNLIACQIAREVGVSTTIARVRNPEYTEPDFPIPRERLGPDLIIHPEKETAATIVRLIRRSIATDVIEFGDGKLQLLGIRLEGNAPILRIPLKELGEEFKGLPMRIVAINRKEHTIVPRGDDVLVPGDQIFVLSDPGYFDDIIRLTGKTNTRINNIMILGGGLISQFIARELGEEIHIKIIENRLEKSEYVADILPNCLVIHGDGTDIDLLAVEGITDMDAFIAVTGSDETNIIATLVARHLKVPRTIALVNNVDYMPITPTIGMDAVVSKQLITVNAVQRYILHQQVTSIASLPGMDAQIIEYITTPHSKITKKPLKKIHFPRNAIVGAVVHDGKVIIPMGDTQISAGDKVVIFTLPRALHEVEKLIY